MCYLRNRKKCARPLGTKMAMGMKGLFCKPCFDNKEVEYNKIRNFCSMCGVKLGVIRYNPKQHWAIVGQICRSCWDTQKAKND